MVTPKCEFDEQIVSHWEKMQLDIRVFENHGDIVSLESHNLLCSAPKEWNQWGTEGASKSG